MFDKPKQVKGRFGGIMTSGRMKGTTERARPAGKLHAPFLQKSPRMMSRVKARSAKDAGKIKRALGK